jgi:casein kinase II subunit alpha
LISFRNADDYEVLSKIGRGKYSEVYTGLNVVTDEKVVIKILKPGKKCIYKEKSENKENLKGG